MVALAAQAAFGGLSVFTGLQARSKRRRARKLQNAIVRIQNQQAKRAFRNRFRQAQADTLVAGALSGASIDSSITQGTLASQETQFNIGEEEANAQIILGGKRDAALNQANKLDFLGSIASSAGSFAGQGPD